MHRFRGPWSSCNGICGEEWAGATGCAENIDVLGFFNYTIRDQFGGVQDEGEDLGKINNVSIHTVSLSLLSPINY